jgi:hypothetical protein
MKNTMTILLAAVLAAPLAAQAQKSLGNIVGGGLGTAECSGFVEAMTRAKAQAPGSTGYAGETQGYAMYLSGFQTAYNLQTPQTCDIFAGWNNNQILERIEKFCRDNPEARFGNGVIALAKERYPNRSKKC